MKCSESSIGSLGIIECTLKDIKEDTSPNTMTECIELIQTQLGIIKLLEEPND